MIPSPVSSCRSVDSHTSSELRGISWFQRPPLTPPPRKPTAPVPSLTWTEIFMLTGELPAASSMSERPTPGCGGNEWTQLFGRPDHVWKNSYTVSFHSLAHWISCAVYCRCSLWLSELLWPLCQLHSLPIQMPDFDVLYCNCNMIQ